MVNDKPRLHATHLAQPAVYCYAAIYKSQADTLPGLAFIELLLVHGLN